MTLVNITAGDSSGTVCLCVFILYIPVGCQLLTDKLREQLLEAEFVTLSGVSLTYQLINLGKRGVLDMQPVCGDAI